MFFIKRSWLYVTRKLSKVVLIGIILFVISTLVLSGLLITSAANSAFKIARNKLGASVTYTTDLSSVMQNNQQSNERPSVRGNGSGFELPDDFKAITTKEIEYIAQNSEYVKNYIISASLAAEAVDFSYYTTSTSNSNENNQFDGGRGGMNSASINIIGVDIQKKDTTFNSDNNELIEGRYFTDEEIKEGKNVIIIEKTIASLNSITIGDTITVEKQDRTPRRESDESIEETTDENSTSNDIVFEIVGIYETKNPTDLSTNNFRGSFNLTENTMYAPYTTVLKSDMMGLSDEEQANKEDEIEQNGYQVTNVIFNLNNPEDIDSFIAEVKKMSEIDTTYRTLSANDSTYQKMVGSISNVAETSKVMVIVIILSGAFIIGLLSMLFIKDRKYELGVLLSLGESRFKIIAQLITEMLIVSIVSISLATLASNFTAQGVTNYLLNQEIANTEENNNNQNNFGPGNGQNRGGNNGNFMGVNRDNLANLDIETIEELTVTVNTTDVLKMYGIGIFLVVLGNVIQASFVLKCKPKEILLER